MRASRVVPRRAPSDGDAPAGRTPPWRGRSRPTEHRSHDDDASLMRRHAAPRAAGWTPRRPLIALPGRPRGMPGAPPRRDPRAAAARRDRRPAHGPRRRALRRGRPPEGARGAGEAAARAGGEAALAPGRPRPGDRLHPDRPRRHQREPRARRRRGSPGSRRRSSRCGRSTATSSPRSRCSTARSWRSRRSRPRRPRSCASARRSWRRACARPIAPIGRRSSRRSSRPARSPTSWRTSGSYLDLGDQDRALAGRIEADARTLDALRGLLVETRSAAAGAARARRSPRSASSTPAWRSCKAAKARLVELQTETAAAARDPARGLRPDGQEHGRPPGRPSPATWPPRRSWRARSRPSSPASASLGNIPSEYNGTLLWPLSGDDHPGVRLHRVRAGSRRSGAAPTSTRGSTWRPRCTRRSAPPATASSSSPAPTRTTPTRRPGS